MLDFIWRFEEALNYTELLKRAHILVGGASSALQTEKEDDLRSPAGGNSQQTDDGVVVVKNSDELLRAMMKQHPVLLSFSSAVLEKAYQVFHHGNHHLLIVAAFLFSVVLFAIGLRSDNQAPGGEVFIGILFLDGILALLLMTKGSPLRLRNQGTRTIVAEVLRAYAISGPKAMFLQAVIYQVQTCEKKDKPGCFEQHLINFIAGFFISAVIGPRFKYFLLEVAIWATSLVVMVAVFPENLGTSGQILLLATAAVLPIFVQCAAGWEASNRASFEATLQLVVKKHKSATLAKRVDAAFTFILPKSVLKAVMAGDSVFHANQATVIHSDICNFTNWCNCRESSTVVDMLSAVVSAFDDKALSLGITRVKTLGDGYIAAAGLPESQENHADRGIRFALSLQGALSKCCILRRSDWGELDVRVGVHSGQTYAGMLSSQRWSYDLYGSVPQIAALLEPLSPRGGLLFSKYTLSLVGDAHLRDCINQTVSGEGPMIQVPSLDATMMKSSSENQGAGEFEIRTIIVEDAALLEVRLTGGKASNLVLIDVEMDVEEEEEGPTEQHSMPPAGIQQMVGNENEEDRMENPSTAALLPEVRSMPPAILKQALHSNATVTHPDEVSEDLIPQLKSDLLRLAARTNFVIMCFATVLFICLKQRNPSATIFVASAAILMQGGSLLTQHNGSLYVALLLVSTIATCALSALPALEGASVETLSESFFRLGQPLLFIIPHPNEIVAHCSWIVPSAARAILLLLFVGETQNLTLLGQLSDFVTICASLSISRYVFKRRFNNLESLTEKQKTAVSAIEEERKKLITILALKMPQHVIDGITEATDSSVVGGDVFKTCADLPSTLVAFIRFDTGASPHLGPHEGGENATIADRVSSPCVIDELMRIIELMDDFFSVQREGHLEPRANKHLQKVKSIGDTFLIAGSLLPTLRVSTTELFCELLHIAQQLSLRIPSQQHTLSCKIGAHTGTVTAATIGNANLEFDVFGTTVNTAARVLAALSPVDAKIALENELTTGFPVSENHLVQLLGTDELNDCFTHLKKNSMSGNLMSTTFPKEYMDTVSFFDAVEGPKFYAKGLGEVKSHFFTQKF